MRNMKTLNYLVAGMIGLGSFGVASNVRGQEIKKDSIGALELAFKKNNIVDSVISITNSMIPNYNQCIRNGTKNNKDECEKIFLVKLTTCDSLLNEFKQLSLQPIKKEYYEVVEFGQVFDYGEVPFTDKNADKLLNINKKFYNATEFLINNPSQKNYNNWKNELEAHKKSVRGVFGQ